MTPKNNSEREDGMRDEYDFSGGVRGKFYVESFNCTNLVLLDPDVGEAFRDSEAANQALRTLITVAKNQSPESR
jgi:hypothetical protein